jgi:hypothetical protein
MSLSTANFNLFMDRMCQYYERMRGGSAYGIGESGDTDKAYDAVTDLLTDITATADSSVIGGLYNTALKIQTETSGVKVATRLLTPAMIRLEGLIRGLALTSVDTVEDYLTYYNIGTGGDWNTLAPPQWRELYYQWRRAYPALYNCYFEILEGGTFRGTTYTNALAKFEVTGAGTGNYTNGAAVDYTKYCGGVGKLKVSSLTGTGNVTVTGLGINPATGAVTASSTWITSITGDGTTTMTVGAGTAPADCLLVDVTNVTIAAGITAGTIYVECHKPTGRQAVP